MRDYHWCEHERLKMKKAYLFNVALLSVSVLSAPASRAQDYTRWNLPEGALARLGKGRVKSAVYSADGTRLVVNSSIGIWIYDAHTGAEVALIPETSVPVALSSDGATLASTSGGIDKMIRLWDADSGQLKAILEGYTAGVFTVAFSPDGATLASGHKDNTIRLWDVDSKQLKNILEGHTDWISSVAFSPDGATLASGSWDYTVRLWDVNSGQSKNTLKGHDGRVASVAFSPDGTTLASGSWDGTVQLWDVDSGEIKDTLKWYRTWISSMSYSPDGTTLVASGTYDGTVQLWDVDSGEIKDTLELPGDVYSVAYTPDGASLVVVSSLDVAYTPDGASQVTTRGHGTMRLWDVDSGQIRATLPEHTIWVSTVAFSPDGATLASRHMDNTMRLWDVTSGRMKIKNTLTLPRHIVWSGSVAFSPDGTTLASGHGDGAVRLWDVTSGKAGPILLQGDLGAVVSVIFAPDGATLASGGFDGTVRLWDTDSGQLKTTLKGHNGPVSSMVYSLDGTTLASSSKDDAIQLWDVASGQLKAILKGQVRSMVFSPDGATLASSSKDDAIQLWDVASGQLKAILEGHLDDTGDWITSVAYSPDGTTLAGGGSDGTIQLWDVVSGQRKATLEGHTSYIHSVAFSPDSKTLASASRDGTILLWDVLNILYPPADISVPLGFAVERWLRSEPVAIDLITNREYGTGIIGATILNAASDDGEVLLWRYSADSEELVARIPAELVNAVPTVRFDQTGLFDNKLFLTINAGPDGQPTTHVLIVEPNGEFRDPIHIYSEENPTQASIEFINQPNYPAGAYIYYADFGRDQSFYRLDESFNPHLIAYHSLPSGRSDIDPMDLKADPTGKYGGLLTLSDTDLNHDELSGLYQLQADGEWRTLVPPAPVTERQFQGIAFSNAGPLGSALYVADAVTDNIWVVTPKGVLEAFAVGFTNPQHIAIGPEGTDMWVTDQTGLYRIFSTDPSDWEAAEATLPVASSLEPNYPNPFKSSTQIPYRVSAPGPVRLVIYNVLGQPVRTLVDGVQAAGAYQVSWDGRDHRGARVANGVYLYRLRAGTVARVRKMLVLE